MAARAVPSAAMVMASSVVAAVAAEVILIYNSACAAKLFGHDSMIRLLTTSFSPKLVRDI